MALAQSKLTAQGQVSVPAEVRRKLGAVPGSILEWDEEDGKIVVRRAAKCTSLQIHKALVPEGPPKRRSVRELQDAIRAAVLKRHARD
jgi:AbrB family looped-hinge helix DNA binding protein